MFLDDWKNADLLKTHRSSLFLGAAITAAYEKTTRGLHLVVSRVPSLGRPPARPKQILPYPSPPEARTSKKYVGSIKLDTQIRTW